MASSSMPWHGSGTTVRAMWGEALALACALTWAMSVILFKSSETVPPQAMNLFKNVLAALLLGATLPLVGQSIDVERPPLDWAMLVASGVLGLAVADTLFFVALRKLGPTMLAVVECAYSPFIVLLSMAFLGERLGWGLILGAPLVVGGVLVVTREGTDKALISPESMRIGLLAGMGCMAVMAVGVVLAKGPLERGELVEVTLVRLLAGVAGQVVWIGFTSQGKQVLHALRPGPVWKTLVPASILGSYVSMLLWLGGFKWADASVAAVLNQMATVFTPLLAWFFLREPMTPRRALGIGVAFFGVCAILWL